VQEKEAIKAGSRTQVGQCDSQGSATPRELVTNCCSCDAGVMGMANLVAHNRSQAGVQLISHPGSSADSGHPSGLCHPYHACSLREISAPIPCLIQELWYLEWHTDNKLSAHCYVSPELSYCFKCALCAWLLYVSSPTCKQLDKSLEKRHDCSRLTVTPQK